MSHAGLPDDDDPFYARLAPPADETEEQRQIRVAEEAEAKSRSDAIDQELNRERISQSKNKTIKVLLLGQSESGKSTTLKSEPYLPSEPLYCPSLLNIRHLRPRFSVNELIKDLFVQAFRSERHSWRAIVHLNIVRSIRLILNVVNAVEAKQLSSHNRGADAQSPLSPRNDHPPLTPELLEIRNRLNSLLQLEDLIWRNLSRDRTQALDGTRMSTGPVVSPADSSSERSVNSTSAWQVAVGRLFGGNKNETEEDEEEVDVGDESTEISEILREHIQDMNALWRDSTVQAITKVHGLNLTDMAGFFLDSLERVTAPQYIPTDDDILRARLKTLGVSEHRFQFRTGDMVSHDWRVFDVGGARSARAAWVPYFQDVDSIIFLAPLSAFDQMLAEDPKVNRLEDSMTLWKKVVSHQLLKGAHIILFLNKTDLFAEKLRSGIKFADWVTSFGDRPNTLEEVSGYMSKKFGASLKRYSPEPRPFYCHMTSVTHVQATAKILDNVRHVILRKILQDSSLM